MALAITVNLICFGPMSSMIDLATGGGTIEEATSAEAMDVAVDIAREGMVLLKNDGGLLPLANGSGLNLFGWSSTNPVYGGTGSGSLNDAYHTVSILESLENAGFQVNPDLTDFYTGYRAERATVGMWDQDWTLPEPGADQYSDALISGAKDFSDVAMVVISRPGGENADLPADMAAVLYPFGHGLSYTTFEYSDLKVSDKEATFTLTNTGSIKRSCLCFCQRYSTVL